MVDVSELSISCSVLLVMADLSSRSSLFSSFATASSIDSFTIDLISLQLHVSR